jgi:hypothetical protein
MFGLELLALGGLGVSGIGSDWGAYTPREQAMIDASGPDVYG